MASTGVAEASKNWKIKNLEIVSHGPAHRPGYQKLNLKTFFSILISFYIF